MALGSITGFLGMASFGGSLHVQLETFLVGPCRFYTRPLRSFLWEKVHRANCCFCCVQVAFTGSTEVGQKIMTMAGETNLKVRPEFCENSERACTLSSAGCHEPGIMVE